MKTIFDKQTQTELIHRINLLDENSQRKWGTMNVFQMLKHNTYWNGWVLGYDNPTYKEAFLGKLVGKMVWKSILKDEKPLDKNIPTSEQFKVKTSNGDLEVEKVNWIGLIQAYAHYSNPNFIHDFFGRMSKAEIGILVYKHTDHHLRQFGV